MKRLLVVCSLAVPFWAWAQVSAPAQPDLASTLSEISAERIRHDIETLVAFGTRHTLSDTASNVRGIGAARRWLFQEFSGIARTSEGRLSVRFDETLVGPSPRISDSTRVTNVVATLRGRRSVPSPGERVLIVGAHYDSRASDAMDARADAPGANDDASGTAVLLELARVLSHQEFDATILLVAFAGEEQGLLGATSLAERARAETWNIAAMLNNDMIGNIEAPDGSVDSVSVRLFAEALSPLDTGGALRTRRVLGLENDGVSRTLARTIQEIGSRCVPDLSVRLIYRRDRFLRGGDHSAFHDRGFPAVRLVESKENTDRQHRNVRGGETEKADLPTYVNVAYAARIARLNAAVLITLASAPPSPAQAEIVIGGPVHRSTLRWAASRAPDLAGYLVRVRQTNSPQWEETHFTRDTTLTLERYKDDVLFGVQAVDRDGYVSLPAIPLPGR
jgi:hypothetical protein